MTESVNDISITSNVIRSGGSCGDIEVEWKVGSFLPSSSCDDTLLVDPNAGTLMFSHGMVRMIFSLSYLMKYNAAVYQT